MKCECGNINPEPVAVKNKNGQNKVFFYCKECKKSLGEENEFEVDRWPEY